MADQWLTYALLLLYMGGCQPKAPQERATRQNWYQGLAAEPAFITHLGPVAVEQTPQGGLRLGVHQGQRLVYTFVLEDPTPQQGPDHDIPRAYAYLTGPHSDQLIIDDLGTRIRYVFFVQARPAEPLNLPTIQRQTRYIRGRARHPTTRHAVDRVPDGEMPGTTLNNLPLGYRHPNVATGWSARLPGPVH